MRPIYKYLKFILLAGAFLLTGIDAGAADIRKSEPKFKTYNKPDSSVINEAEITDNDLYVDKWIKKWFALLDKNQDNRISKSEFMENLEFFNFKEHHLTVFQTGGSNADGSLNLVEFKSFIDTTNLFSKDQLTTIATSNTDPVQTDSVNIIKMLTGALAIILVMAAFKLM